MSDRRTFIKTSLVGLPLIASIEASGLKPARFKIPVIVSTWDSGIRANAAGWPLLERGGRALDAVEAAGRQAEEEPSCCVGLDALPDRDGIVTLDACIMDEKANIGAVSFLDRIKHPVSVARRVMETTPHVMLSGDGARKFAVENGFPLESGKLSAESEKQWKEWLKKSSYKPTAGNGTTHDTMGTIANDARGDLSGMVTTSGLAYKIHGRVGDSPIIGAGLFVDNDVGAATSSGIGEEVIRICGTHTVIEQMRVGRSPLQACQEAVRRIVKRDPAKASAKDFQVGFVALSKRGKIGAFSVQRGFVYSVTNSQFPQGRVFPSPSHFPG
jgi:N4-(beta-N-acetylglucosaminyl)-L-asparaginase